MPLQLPVLDDRRFDDLAAEGRALVPTFAPDWTNHNPSDPGIILLELFAYLTEMLVYRLDRITTADVAVFLNLLDGKQRDAGALAGTDVAAEVRGTIQALRTLDRAITADDFETLALEADPQRRVERTRCVPRRNLEVDTEREKAGHVSVIVLPTAAAQAELPALIAAVDQYMAPRVLLTTRHHVVAPFFVDVAVKVTVVPALDQTEVEEVAPRVQAAVRTFLDPHTGGEDGRGWPFGRNVFVSELYALVDRLPDVDHVTDVDLSQAPTPPERLLRQAPEEGGRQIGVAVRPHELVRAAAVVVELASS